MDRKTGKVHNGLRVSHLKELAAELVAKEMG